MNIQLLPDEKVVIEVFANHFQGLEGVGGKLYVTNQRVFFKSHPINIQVHELSIPFSDIKSYGKRSTAGIIPNGVFVEKSDGVVEKFVVWKRKKILQAIEENMS